MAPPHKQLSHSSSQSEERGRLHRAVSAFVHASRIRQEITETGADEDEFEGLDRLDREGLDED
jgi:hypothetical protein